MIPITKLVEGEKPLTEYFLIYYIRLPYISILFILSIVMGIDEREEIEAYAWSEGLISHRE